MCNYILKLIYKTKEIPNLMAYFIFSRQNVFAFLNQQKTSHSFIFSVLIRIKSKIKSFLEIYSLIMAKIDLIHLKTDIESKI